MTTPTGRPDSTTITAPCARFGSRASASETVSVRASVIGVSWTMCRCLTQDTTSATTSIGMSCGMTVMPPRRATVSAIRRPATAVMFATTSGIVVPEPSLAARSTAYRESMADRPGTMNTSSKVRSYGGGESYRKRIAVSISTMVSTYRSIAPS